MVWNKLDDGRRRHLIENVHWRLDAVCFKNDLKNERQGSDRPTNPFFPALMA